MTIRQLKSRMSWLISLREDSNFLKTILTARSSRTELQIGPENVFIPHTPKVTPANSFRLRPRVTGYHGCYKVTEAMKIERPVGRTLPTFRVLDETG